MLSARTTKRMASSFTRGNVQRDWMVLVSGDTAQLAIRLAPGRRWRFDGHWVGGRYVGR